MRVTATTGKIRHDHLSRDAIVYIRQSSAHQVREHRESTDRQYGLTERARLLGWPKGAVKHIDEDQGRSATASTHRLGFKKLLAEIGAGQVGIVLALEASRLSRSSADWHRLVEICVVTSTLLADESAVYDPRDPNDRLLLGVKGTISEAELFTLRQRLHDGRWNKAKRGELTRSLPVGYVRTESGEVTKDPDAQVRARLGYIFDLFKRLRVARKVLLQLRKEKLRIPARLWGGPRHGEIIWKDSDFSAVVRILHNPTYTGTYVYGQCDYDSFDRSPRTGKARVRFRAVEDWPVCLHEVFPAYISWEAFMDNQRTLRSNWYRSNSHGAPRKGAALLQGIVFCGRCGSRMSIQHYATKEKRSPVYACLRAYQREGGLTCQCMSAHGVDEAVTRLFLDAVSPAKVEIALRALAELERTRQQRCRQWELQVQQAEYEAQVAEKRYESTDPENRLVASELEARWEESLRHLAKLRRDYEEFVRRQDGPISAEDRRLVEKLAGNLEQVWDSETTSMQERKTLLRFLIRRVHLDGVTESEKIRIGIEWHTGAQTTTKIDRPQVGIWAPKTSPEVEERIRQLLPQADYASIAETLNRDGMASAKGKAFDSHTVGYVVRSRGWGRRSNNRKGSQWNSEH